MGTALITGVLGYVAPAVLQSMPEGWSAVGIDAGYFGSVLQPGVRPPETRLSRLLFKDVRDLDKTDLRGFDAVIHLAALSNDPIGKEFDSLTDRVNAQESHRVAKLAREAGVRRFVFASSGSVYGAGGTTPRDEGSETAPLTAYALSKVRAESLLQSLADDDFRVTCLRFATACGWSPRVRLDLVLNDFVASALTTGRIDVLSDGSPWRPLVHIGDMARAIWWAASADLSGLDPYILTNVGRDDWNFQVKDLARIVTDEIPGTAVTINTEALPDLRSYRVSFARWRDLAPEAQPVASLGAVVQELADRLRNHPYATPDFRSSPLVRLHVLRGLREAGQLDGDLRWV